MRRLSVFFALVILCVCAGQSLAQQQVSQDEVAAFQAHMRRHWDVPKGIKTPIEVQFTLNRDGTLASSPKVLTTGEGEAFAVASESAVAAVVRSAPFSMFKPESFEEWRDIKLTLDPAYVFRR